jgi:hypothetical protein
MENVAAVMPAAGGRRGGGEAAGADRDHLGRAVGDVLERQGGVLHADRPACLGWRRPGHGGVAAQADQDAAAEAAGDFGRRAVGRPALDGRAEVELDAGRDRQLPGRDVDRDRAPARDHPDADGGRARYRRPRCRDRLELREVAVVAERRHDRADGGVHVAVGQLGRP